MSVGSSLMRLAGGSSVRAPSVLLPGRRGGKCRRWKNMENMLQQSIEESTLKNRISLLICGWLVDGIRISPFIFLPKAATINIRSVVLVDCFYCIILRCLSIDKLRRQTLQDHKSWLLLHTNIVATAGPRRRTFLQCFEQAIKLWKIWDL